MTVIIFFICGLIIGSFLNVVVYRLNLVENILGRSHCPHCRKKIRWYDNVPILSFIILGARCRDCEEKISWQYPLVEFSTGAVFALTGFYFFSEGNALDWMSTLFYLGIFSVLIVIFVYDLKFMEIPMIVLWAGVIWSIAFYLFFDWQIFQPAAGIFSLKIFSGIMSGTACFLFFFTLAAGSREKWMGMGDAYLGLLAGLVCGWPVIVLAFLIAVSSGASVGIVLTLMKKKTMKSRIPFGPFLAFGVFLSIIFFQAFPSIKYYFFPLLS